MSLIRVEGNLIQMIENGDINVAIHGCNCQNVMGSGIAKSLRNKWSGVYEADCLATKQWKNPIAKLGNFSTYNTDRFVIINAYTQLHYLPRGVDHFEYESFYLILRKLEALSSEISKFGFPYIGMGLAGGDEKRIIPMIEAFAERAAIGGSKTFLISYKE